jgi:hypothetical protein
MKTRGLRAAGLSLALSSLALLIGSAQAGTARSQPGKAKHTAAPLTALAMDGPRVAYMMENRRVGVWNLVTGSTSTIKGTYPSIGHHFGYGSGEVAIAGRRVALITRFVIGNTLQTQERLYTAPIGGSARQLGTLTNHSSNTGDCTVPGSGGSFGSWIGGLVGSGKVLAVSTWNSGSGVTSHQRLHVILPTGLRTIASGRGVVVSQSADGGHIAVLRSTEAWPSYQGPLEQSTPLVGVYSSAGALLGQVALAPLPDSCSYPLGFVRIALTGNRLVVLRLDVPKAGSLTATVDVYDWRTGALVQTWPLALSHVAPIADRLYVSGRIAIVEGAFRLRMLDLTTGKETIVAGSQPNAPATLGSRGLVYAVNPFKDGRPGKLVFVPTARLLAGSIG